MSSKISKIATLIGMLSLSMTVFTMAQEELMVYEFEDLARLQSQEQRPIFVFLTAEWCRYCKSVERISFEDDEVIRKLNTEFYTILFDIEDEREIKLFGRNFRFKSTGLNTGVHELAELIGTVDGVLNTPTFIVFDSNLRIQYQYGGFMDTDEIMTLLSSATR